MGGALRAPTRLSPNTPPHTHPAPGLASPSSAYEFLEARPYQPPKLTKEVQSFVLGGHSLNKFQFFSYGEA